jgi:catechol 2,3-dioxygenase-like lactoylglutathione lyase family enzyme
VSSTDTGKDSAPQASEGGRMDLRLEVVGLPVSDIDRAKEFYATILGWRLDADFDVNPDFRVVQITPPGSPCSIQFGRGITAAAPGSVDHIYLVVSDVVAARDELAARGVEVSEVFHLLPGEEPKPGPDPERGTYQSFASFSDPDGNRWLLQEITTRLPGR